MFVCKVLRQKINLCESDSYFETTRLNLLPSIVNDSFLYSKNFYCLRECCLLFCDEDEFSAFNSLMMFEVKIHGTGGNCFQLCQ